MNISFDFDGTLIHVNHLVERFQLFGDNIFIITSRDETKNNDSVFQWAEDLNILKQNIHFTNHQSKLDTINKLNIDMHFDDDEIDVTYINSNSKCKVLLVNFKIDYSND